LGAKEMKYRLKAFVALVVFLLVPLVALTEEKNKTELAPMCPVSGKEINKNFSVTYLGGKLYFANSESLKTFQANTEKYVTRANMQLVITGQARQKACPLMGKIVIEGKSVTVAGIKVDLCCTMCQKKLTKAKPEEQVEMVFGKNFDKGYTVNKS
jgi:YHS domain-containing protein